MLGGKGEKGKGNISETMMKCGVMQRHRGGPSQLKMSCNITCIMKVVSGRSRIGVC